MTLRPVQPSDMETVLEWAEQPHLAEYFRRYPPTLDWSSPNAFMQAVGTAYIALENELPVGMAQLAIEDQKAKVVSVGMLVDRRRTSSTKSSLSMYKQLCAYCFNECGVNKLQMRILSSRSALKERLLENNWKLEGTLRSSCLFRGELRDEDILGLTKRDYELWNC